MSVNLLDIIILVPLLLFAWNGYKKGFIIEVASLAALLIGLYMAFFFSDFAAEMLNDLFDIDQKYVAVFAFLITFIANVYGDHHDHLGRSLLRIIIHNYHHDHHP